jgi:site-specific DNA-methyltransferase (adenine-specific)/modification methylase
LSNEDNYKYKWIWEKSKPTNFLNAKKQPLRKHEDVCIFYKNQPTYNPQMTLGEAYDKGTRKDQLSGSYGDFKPVRIKSDGLRYPTDIIYCKTAEAEGTVYHPTQKPGALLEYLIKTYTNEDDLVLDNCMGSGSTGVACINTKRNFIGIELDENYFNIAKNRIEESVNSRKLKIKKIIK